ncbi:threonine/serine exporter family protein [Nocardia sp. BSTN01]|uniref:threonine/serine ThrE exporter family protein n=1 Tax=Nocardia sp. BSTN01 TaxID=2783665 RepID=UPI00188DF4AE|nr:threonine/serine exporter family protein [Nocardia sp. BSTN01]MBF4997035.1 threonine/serine exporter family protein [Nocardia sp. BSTN01]
MGAVTDRLVAQRRATVDSVVEAPAPLKPIDLTDDAAVTEVLDLAERVGEVVLASGTAVTDTSTQVEFIAATYGLAQCDIDVTYNSIRISADRGPSLPPASTMRVVQYRSLDFTRLTAVDRLTRRIRREVVPPQEAHAALDAITTAPHPYNRWVATFGWSLLAASIALLLGGGVLVAAVSFATTLLIDRCNRELNKRGLPFFFQNMMGGIIATLPAILLQTFAEGLETNPSLIVAAGITVLLSGLQLVGAVEDAITGAPITAAARMLEVLVMTGAIIGGVGLALRGAQAFGAQVPPIDMSPSYDITNLPLKITAGAVAAAAFALACYAERRALTVAAISGAGITVCYLFVQHAGFGPVIAAAVSATAIGLAGGLLARRAVTPPLVVAIAGITPLLPGLKVYRGLFALINDDLLVGLNQMFAALVVGCALGGGITLGEWFARWLRRPRILRRVTGVRPDDFT